MGGGKLEESANLSSSSSYASSSFSSTSLSSSSFDCRIHHEFNTYRPPSPSSSSSSLSCYCLDDDHDHHDHDIGKERNEWLRFVGPAENPKGSMHWIQAEQRFDRIASSSSVASASSSSSFGFCLGLKFMDEGRGNGANLKEVEERFDRVASCASDESIATIDSSHFAYCIGMQDTPEFAGELLKALRGRRKHDMKLTKRELLDYLHRLTTPCFDSKLRLFFDMCDEVNDGRISKADLKQMILLSAATNKVDMKQEEAADFALLIMQEVDAEEKGYIELHQLRDLFKAASTKGHFSSHQHLTLPNTQTSHDGLHQEDHQEPKTMSLPEILFRQYWRRAWVVALWLVACIALFSWKFIQYRHRAAFQVMGYCLCTAKGAAETLKLNMALVLLPVCRNFITWLRMSRRIAYFIPFNDNINFHKLIAGGIVMGVILHGGTHVGCDIPRITGSDPTLFERTFGRAFGEKQPTYLQVLCTTEVATGIAMVIVMAIAFCLATRVSRRRSRLLPGPIRRVTGYNAFWYSHHLLIIVYILLIIHSSFLFLTDNFAEKTTWMYLAIPVLLYFGERIYRSIRSEIREVDVLEAKVYTGKVLCLRLSKPAKFTFKSGMYIYVKCPQVSPLEWHPFSLTSGPNDDHLSIHIRTLGDWSDQILNLFQEAVLLSNSLDNYPKVYIDGPYGAASQDHVKYDIVVLIGLGIGATPFISVLKDIEESLQKPPLNHGSDEENGVVNRPLKAYLYWVTREYGSLAWFKDVMKGVSSSNHKQKVVEVHNFLTSVYQSGDARSILLSIIQALYFAKSGMDVFSKTQVQTHFSRPNWLKIFSNLAWRHAGSCIGVFYCGSSNLARELEGLCTKFSTKTTTRFVFHKENY